MDRQRSLRAASTPLRTALLGLALGVFVMGCGGGTPAGAGGGGGDMDAAIAGIQALYGTTMTSGTFDGTTLTITLSRGASKAMADLFCPRVVDILVANGVADVPFVVLEDGSGKELSTDAAC